MLFMFPGQGSQKIGMGKDLYENFATARDVFGEVDDALSFRLSQLMFNGDESELRLTENAQPAIMTVSMAFMRILEKDFSFDLSRHAKYFAGHSLGEYSALCAAKILTLTETARILTVRGKAMAEAYPSGGAMAAILGLSVKEVEKSISDTDDVEIANDNCVGQVVISGSREAVENAVDKLKGQGAKRTVLLSVSGPFHSKFMKPAEQALRDALGRVSFRGPVGPIISNVTAKAELTNFEDLLIKQLTNRVRWRESLLYAQEHEVSTFVEVGNGNVLSGLAKRTLFDANVVTINSVDAIEKFVANLD